MPSDALGRAACSSGTAGPFVLNTDTASSAPASALEDLVVFAIALGTVADLSEKPLTTAKFASSCG